MDFFGLGPTVTVGATFAEPSDASSTRTVSVKSDASSGGVATTPTRLYTTGDTIAGAITLTTPPGSKVDHLGVKVEVLGQIEMGFDRGHAWDFVALAREARPAGDLIGVTEIPFVFKDVEMPHESYEGINARCRYVVRTTVTRTYGGTVTHDLPFVVRNVSVPPENDAAIKMEVGIEDCLHIEFEYAKAKYHLRDCVVGKIHFLLVRIKIKHMELEIRRRESTGAGANTYNESETVAKFEVMDGAPVKGETAPVRLFLSPYDLTPTYKNVANRFNVKYYLNLVLVDEEDRRYFKQQEIFLYRDALE